MLFKYFTTLCGIREIEGKDEKEILDIYNKSKLSDFLWRPDKNRTDRTTYEVICQDTPNEISNKK